MGGPDPNLIYREKFYQTLTFETEFSF